MKKILELQKIDAELMQLEKLKESSNDHETLNKMSGLYKDIQNKLKELEEKSAKHLSEYNQALDSHKKSLKESGKLAKTDTSKLSEEKIGLLQESANQISSQLFMLERKMNMLLVEINNSIKDFEVLKSKAMTVRAKHAESKEKIEASKLKMQPKIDDYIAQIAKLESGIDKNILAKYKALKNDNIFPVYVSLNEKRCGYCRVELPSFKLDKLKNEEFIVCEQCGRIIYKTE